MRPNTKTETNTNTNTKENTNTSDHLKSRKSREKAMMLNLRLDQQVEAEKG